MTRPSADDRALCLHEAAHAVIAEALRPGCVVGIEMDCQASEHSLLNEEYLFAAGVEAACFWIDWEYADTDHLVAVAAGREGELIEPSDYRFDEGDIWVLDQYAWGLERRRVRRRAKALVKKHELAIRRVAAALRERRVMTGDEIRESIAMGTS